MFFGAAKRARRRVEQAMVAEAARAMFIVRETESLRARYGIEAEFGVDSAGHTSLKPYLAGILKLSWGMMISEVGLSERDMPLATLFGLAVAVENHAFFLGHKGGLPQLDSQLLSLHAMPEQMLVWDDRRRAGELPAVADLHRAAAEYVVQVAADLDGRRFLEYGAGLFAEFITSADPDTHRRLTAHYVDVRTGTSNGPRAGDVSRFFPEGR